MERKEIDAKQTKISTNKGSGVSSTYKSKIYGAGLFCQDVADLLEINAAVLSRIMSGRDKSRRVIAFINDLPESLNRVEDYQRK